MNFSVVNLGCKVNRVESDGFTASLCSRGWGLTSLAEADAIIINTCAVTGEAEKKTRKAVRKALRENERASVIVTGCAATLDAALYENMDPRVNVQTNKDVVAQTAEEAAGASIVPQATSLVSPASPGTTDSLPAPHRSTDSEHDLRIGEGFPTRVGIKIQDGCDHACTYCIVHKARGKAQSRDYDSVQNEVVRYARSGVKELILTGINLGSYRSGEYDLCGLLTSLLDVTDDMRFRISSIEPCDVSARLIALLAESGGRVCRHLHLPLQSGSDRILKEMDRPYSVDYFRDLVDSLYAAVPSISISSDIIVGFPSETEQDFDDTMSVASDARFSKIHIFPYSKRAGTPAAQRSDQVLPDIKAKRVERLTQLGRDLRQADLATRKGLVEDVFVETKGWGTTESYHRIQVPTTAKPGEVLRITL